MTDQPPAEVLADSIRLDVHRAWLLTSNQRLHRRQRDQRIIALRTRSQLAAAPWRRRLAVPTPLEFKVRCEVWVAWPNRRRRDAHNLGPTFKACIDGMVRAGLLADDDDRHLVGPDPRVLEQRCPPEFACSLYFLFHGTISGGDFPPPLSASRKDDQ